MELGSLTVDEGVQLLLRSYSNKDRGAYIDEARKIVKRLVGLALAIDQASSYLKARRKPISQLGSFLQLYEEQMQDILEFVPKNFWEYQEQGGYGARDKDKDLSAFTTWEMSSKELFRDDDDSAERAAHLLTLSAFMASTTIPEFIFRRYWESRYYWTDGYAADPLRATWLQSKSFAKRARLHDEVDNSIDTVICDTSRKQDGAVLHDKSVERDHVKQTIWDTDDFALLVTACEDLSLLQDVSRDGDDGITFSLHPLVRDWLQIRQGNRESDTFIVEVTTAIAGCIQTGHFSNSPLDQRTILSANADQCLSQDLRLCDSKETIDEGPEFFEAVHWHTSYWLAEKETGNARDLLRNALLADVMSSSAAVQARSDNPKQSAHSVWHSLRVTLRRLLAETYRNMLAWPEAETLIREAMELCNEASLEDEQWRICSRVLGDILSSQEHHAGALQIHQDVLDWHLNASSTDYAELYKAKFSVAKTFDAMSEWANAIVIYRELLEAKQGLSIHFRIDVLYQLAFARQKIFEYEEAESSLREALSLSRIHSGPCHLETVSIMYTLNENLLYQAKLDQAIILYHEVLHQQGTEPSIQLWANCNLGMILHQQHNCLMAERILRKVLEAEDILFKEVFLKRSDVESILIVAIQEQGQVAWDTANYEQAGLRYHDAIVVARGFNFDEVGLYLGDLLCQLGRSYHKQSRFAEAEAALCKALDYVIADASWFSIPDARWFSIARIRVHLGAALAHQERWNEAEILFREALDALSDQVEEVQRTSEDVDIEATHTEGGDTDSTSNDDEDTSSDSLLTELMGLALYWLARARYVQNDYANAALLWTDVLGYEDDFLSWIDDDRSQIEQWLRNATEREESTKPQLLASTSTARTPVVSTAIGLRSRRLSRFTVKSMAATGLAIEQGSIIPDEDEVD